MSIRLLQGIISLGALEVHAGDDLVLVSLGDAQ